MIYYMFSSAQGPDKPRYTKLYFFADWKKKKCVIRPEQRTQRLYSAKSFVRLNSGFTFQPFGPTFTLYIKAAAFLELENEVTINSIQATPQG